jgi:hypothetical protein
VGDRDGVVAGEMHEPAAIAVVKIRFGIKVWA